MMAFGLVCYVMVIVVKTIQLIQILFKSCVMHKNVGDCLPLAYKKGHVVHKKSHVYENFV
jgi:hypothetical protein